MGKLEEKIATTLLYWLHSFPLACWMFSIISCIGTQGKPNFWTIDFECIFTQTYYYYLLNVKSFIMYIKKNLNTQKKLFWFFSFFG
jgi:hypothetical protein